MATKSAKSFKKKLKAEGCFYTPEPMARYMASLLPDPAAVTTVYDPTCGGGGLLRIFPDAVKKYGQELDAEQLELCRREIPNFIGYAGNLLTDPAFMDMRFDTIMANPPFSVKWEAFSDPRWDAAPVLPPNGKADYAFILHCLHMLTDDGTAVVMSFPGILYRGQREGKIRQWMVEQNFIEKVIMIPPNQPDRFGEFEDTKIPLALLVLKKHRDTTDILFIDEEHEQRRTVTLEEIQANNFNLSVSTYVELPDTREPIDIVAVTKQADDNIIANLRHSLYASQFVYQVFGGGDFPALLQRAQGVLDEFKAGDDSDEKRGR